MCSSAIFVAAAMSTGVADHDDDTQTFHNYYECWLVEQNQFLLLLIDAAAGSGSEGTTSSSNDEYALVLLVEKVLQHYADYYGAKSRWVKVNVLGMLSPSWRTQLEEAFVWIGGWRPSIAFHLLYSKSGLQLESRINDLVRGLSTGDLGDLSPDQLLRVDESQSRIIREERDITEMLAKHQETVADTSMVNLSHVVSELIRSGGRPEKEEERVESTLLSKKQGLEEILEKADHLRLRTLRETIGILKPMQAVHYLIAAAELRLRLHDWGKKTDASHPTPTPTPT